VSDDYLLCGECLVFSESLLGGDCLFCGEYSLFSECSLGGECLLCGEYSMFSEWSLGVTVRSLVNIYYKVSAYCLVGVHYKIRYMTGPLRRFRPISELIATKRRHYKRSR
jgi:hypothetical protein